jgi:Ran GTPase-activating protein (RanGAP) involved in mRNA processing and transport
VLSLKSNALLTKEAGEILGDMLKGNTVLTELDLSDSGNGLESWDKDGPGFAQALAVGLIHNGALKKFDMSLNKIRAGGTAAIADALKGNNTLNELDLSSNQMGWNDAGSSPDVSGAVALANTISDMGALSSLFLSKNALLTKEAGKALGDMLKCNTVLKVLDVSDCVFGMRDCDKEAPGFAQELAAGIKDNGAMTSLDLASNELKAEGAKIVADAIKVASVHLRSFWCHFHVHLASQSTAVVCYCPQDMRALSSANLLSNNISVEQAEVLASILKEHSTLKSLCGNKGDETELDMSGELGGAAGAIMLAPEIIDNGAMTSLNLASNEIDAEGATQIAGALEVRKYILAVILVPHSCPSDHYFYCWCLLLSAGHGGTIEVCFWWWW